MSLRRPSLSERGLLALTAVVCTAAVVWTVHTATVNDLGAGDMAGVLSFGGTAVGLALAVAGIVLTRAKPLPEVADDLAVAVRADIDLEVRVHGLTREALLPVRFDCAEQLLPVDWEAMREHAHQWMTHVPSERDRWATGSADVAGSGSDIEDVLLHRVPTRRMVILGPAGSGKTCLLLLLQRRLTRQRREGGRTTDPVPVLFPLGSWPVLDQPDVRQWMAEVMTRQYPLLAEPLRGGLGREKRSKAQALLDHEWVLPLVDGLDELAAELRPVALRAISDAFVSAPLVLTSRTAEFLQLGSGGAAPTAPLGHAVAIEVQPLDIGQAREHLVRSAGSPAGRRRWEEVFSSLLSGSALEGALTNPLYLGLVSAAYNPAADGRPAYRIDPRELLDPSVGEGRDLRTHLLGMLIPAAYSPARAGGTTNEQRALTYFRWLAQHGRRTSRSLSNPELAWWKLSMAFPRRLAPLCGTVVFGLMAGLASGVLAAVLYGMQVSWTSELLMGPVIGTTYGALAGAVLGCAGQLVVRRESAPAVRTSLPRGGQWLTVAGVALVVAACAGAVVGSDSGRSDGLTAAVGFGGITALLLAIRGRAAVLGQAGGPLETLRADRRVFWRSAVALGSCISLVLVVGTGAVEHPPQMIAPLTLGLTTALLPPLRYTAWLPYWITTAYLSTTGRLPRRLAWFLHDAHHRHGILRQSGGTYQFRHPELARHLTEPPTVGPPPAPGAADTD